MNRRDRRREQAEARALHSRCGGAMPVHAPSARTVAPRMEHLLIDDDKLRHIIDTDAELRRVLRADLGHFAAAYPDWRCDIDDALYGEHPLTHVKACHWVANAQLRLAMVYAPRRSWRIVSSREHSMVWDGEVVILDRLAIRHRTSAVAAWMAATQDGAVMLRPGVYKRFVDARLLAAQAVA